MRLTVERRVTTRVKVDVPPEILMNVFKQLASAGLGGMGLCVWDLRDYRRFCVEDIKKARLVCRAFNYAASPFLIPAVYLSSSPRDLEILAAITKHPTFSKHVSEVIYDCRMFSEAIANDRALYFIESKRRPIYGNHGPALTKEEAKWGFRDYSIDFRQQQQCRNQRLDMECFARALSQMPKLAHARIMGRGRSPYIRLRGKHNNTGGVSTERRITGCHSISPRGTINWPSDEATRAHNALCQNGIRDFLNVLSAPSVCKQMQSLSIGHAIDAEDLRLSPELFGDVTYAESTFSSMLHRMSMIQLSVKFGDADNQAAISAWKSAFKRSLLSAQNLEVLDLTFESSSLFRALGQPQNVVTVDEIMDKESFPHLRELRISSVQCNPSSILDFLAAHRTVLKCLTLNQVTLLQGNASEFIDKLKEMDLKLESCSFSLACEDISEYEYLRSDDVIDYLNGGPRHPIGEALTVEDLEPLDNRDESIAEIGASAGVMTVNPAGANNVLLTTMLAGGVTAPPSTF